MIDALIPETWPQAVIDASARFSQGDLIANPPFFYASLPAQGVWKRSTELAAEVAPDEDAVLELDPAERPRFGIITSQSCDVDDTARKPWVQVAPVYPIADYAHDEKWVAEIRRESVPHLVLLDLASDGDELVADLRIELPIEKSRLSGREPINVSRTNKGVGVSPRDSQVAYNGPTCPRRFTVRWYGHSAGGSTTGAQPCARRWRKQPWSSDFSRARTRE